MAEEIENFLLEKLTNDINEMKARDNKLLSKLVSLYPQFEKLRESLDEAAHFPLGSTRKKEKIYYLNNEVSQWQLISKKQSPFAFVSQALAYNDLNRRLKKVKIEFREGNESENSKSDSGKESVIAAKSVHVLTSLPNSSETYRWSSRNPPSKVHGFEAKIKSLERLIFQRDSDNEKFKAIGVVGVAGIGKTTLCQVIFNQPKVKKYFLPRIWVCLSKQPNEDSDNRKEAVKRILRCLGVEEEVIKDADTRHGLSGLISALHLQLIGKRYLIVLDDASKNEKFYDHLENGPNQNEKWGEELAYGLPKGWGGMVIVTTRVEEIAKKMVGEKNLNFVGPLTDRESSWLIFKDAVGKDENEFPQFLKDLKDKILNKCGGLPLAAKMLGDIAHERLQESPDEIDENQQKDGPDENENQQNEDHRDSPPPSS